MYRPNIVVSTVKLGLLILLTSFQVFGQLDMSETHVHLLPYHFVAMDECLYKTCLQHMIVNQLVICKVNL